MDNIEYKKEKRRQGRLQRLGSNDPQCLFCSEEDDPCCLEQHHLSGKRFGELCVTVCRNHHRKLSDKQEDHPPVIGGSHTSRMPWPAVTWHRGCPRTPENTATASPPYPRDGAAVNQHEHGRPDGRRATVMIVQTGAALDDPADFLQIAVRGYVPLANAEAARP